MMTPIPRPLSALHSMVILPPIWVPATNVGSARAIETLTLVWCGVAFIGSGSSCVVITVVLQAQLMSVYENGRKSSKYVVLVGLVDLDGYQEELDEISTVHRGKSEKASRFMCSATFLWGKVLGRCHTHNHSSSIPLSGFLGTDSDNNSSIYCKYNYSGQVRHILEKSVAAEREIGG